MDRQLMLPRIDGSQMEKKGSLARPLKLVATGGIPELHSERKPASICIIKEIDRIN